MGFILSTLPYTYGQCPLDRSQGQGSFPFSFFLLFSCREGDAGQQREKEKSGENDGIHRYLPLLVAFTRARGAGGFCLPSASLFRLFYSSLIFYFWDFELWNIVFWRLVTEWRELDPQLHGTVSC